MSDPLLDELRARIERRRKLRIIGSSQAEVDADWQDVPLPQPPRQQINWPVFGCVAMAIAAWWAVYAMWCVGESMVDAVLSIQWPV